MIRVFIGTSPDGLDAEMQLVCEHSLRSNSSQPLDITWMRLSRDPASPFYSDSKMAGIGYQGWQTEDWTTPFTPFRWLVPWLCEFKGRAIYTDHDVLFRADIAELWNAPLLPGKAFMAKSPRRLDVCLWDCQEARGFMPTLQSMQAGIKGQVWHDKWKSVREKLWQPFPDGQNWNCIDGDNGQPLDDAVKAVHFSDLRSQPHMEFARSRLRRENGRLHWFSEKLKWHPRKDLINLLVDVYLSASYPLTRYAQEPQFGDFNLRDLAGYEG